MSPYSTRPVKAGPSFAVDWGYAHAHIQRPDGTKQLIAGNGDNGWGESDPETTELGIVVPAMAALQLSQADNDVVLFLGWTGTGVSSRFKLGTTSDGVLASVVGSATLGWEDSFQAGGAFEVVVPVAPGVQALGRLGLSYGRRLYNIEMPLDLDQTPSEGFAVGDAHLKLYRYDGRLETALGIIFKNHLSLSVQPYWVLFQSALEDVSCVSCPDGVTLLDFTQRGGFAVAITVW